MKRILTAALGCLLMVGSVRAGDWDNALRGGLVGGAFGALLGELDGVESGVSIPMFATFGALAGYGYDRGWYRARRYDDCWVDYGWPYARYDHDWRWLNRRQYRTYVHGAPWSRERAGGTAAVTHAPPPARDMHPGVSIVIVPIVLTNGMSVDLRILKLGARYVGPQGEAYETLPTAEELQTRYRLREGDD